MDGDVQKIEVGGASIAVRHRAGGKPGFVWLGGYRSDMLGTKAIELDRFCCENDYACTRFDYSGHGESGGEFHDGTISRWLAEALAVVHRYCNGPQILVGSSMGAWIALRMVQELNNADGPNPIAGLLLLAPAPDFTVELMEPELSDAEKHDLETKGYFEEPTPYGPDPNIFTKALFDDGRENRVMTGPLDTYCPVHIIQGKADPDVPWQHAEKLFSLLSKDDASITYIKDGDHRLSRPEDIGLILKCADELSRRARTSV